jgi:uncharacterized alpha-E superfamily protein
MALLDPHNPRSLAFQLARLDEHLAGLPALAADGMPEAPRRISLRLAAEAAAGEAERLDTAAVLDLEQRVSRLAEAISARYFLESAGARDTQPSGLA